MTGRAGDVGPRPQDLAAGLTVGALGCAIGGLVTGHRRFAAGGAAVAVAADIAARLLSRRYPSPFPARFKFALVHPPGDLEKLRAVLAPQPGERILEIGPGPGHQAIAVATAIGPTGRLDVLDIQPEMIDAVRERASRAGLDNVHGTTADASHQLPFDEATFGAAYVVGVLGELPDADAALREIARVLRPSGRLVVGETFFLDPDFMPYGDVARRAAAAGLAVAGRSGPGVAYLATFEKPEGP